MDVETDEAHLGNGESYRLAKNKTAVGDQPRGMAKIQKHQTKEILPPKCKSVQKNKNNIRASKPFSLNLTGTCMDGPQRARFFCCDVQSGRLQSCIRPVDAAI
jgi:hypothetical protein